MSVSKFPVSPPGGSTQVFAPGPVAASAVTAQVSLPPGVYEYEKFSYISGSLVPANTPSTPPVAIGASVAAAGFDVTVGGETVTASAGLVFLPNRATTLTITNSNWGASAAISAGDSWVARNKGWSGYAYGAANNSSSFVVTGASGSLSVSTDGATWTTRTSGMAAYTANGAAYGAGVWVIGGNGGRLRSSTDTVTWTSRTVNNGAITVYGVSFANSLFVATSGNAGISTSTDGTTWTSRTSNVTGSLRDAAGGAGVIVVCGDDRKITTSTDGATWTSRTSGWDVGVNLRTVSFGASVFIVGGGSGSLSTSTNGTTWTTRTSGMAGTVIYDSTFVNDKFYITGASGKIRSSTDGITWSSITTQSLALKCITATSDTFVIGRGGASVLTSQAGTANYRGETAVVKLVTEDTIVQAL